MNSLSRRHFLKLIGTSTALAATPTWLKAQTAASGRVVIVGGGFAGATAAKYLRHWSGGNVAVTLVDANPAHVSCILSNLALNGSLGLSQITFNYEALKQKYGVTVEAGQAVGAANGQLHLQDGRTLAYDRLILAPGIDFAPVPGLDIRRIPHAWQAGPQTTLLKNQLRDMPPGGVFVLTIPLAPYRCPPGPYERACLVADYLKRNKPGSKVIVLDANPKIMAEEHTFTKAFYQTHAGIIEYHPNVLLNEVDSTNRTAITSQGNFSASVLNVLPPQKAGKIVSDLGLTGGGNWAPVDPLTYESTVAKGIHIIGDSQGTSQPKSGHIANSEAKVCADAILRAFAGELPDPAPTTNSACYSPITAKTASWLTAVFAYDPETRAMKLVPEAFGEAPEATEENYEKMFDWASNLFAETFA
ncbi:MAG: FAD-dependent oxidoreductase [Candidatus Competibacteraceae bacterium]|nr:FAD-dependent oxidoreductase [Candidatus Competibacteraceae bacterium]MCB1822782.1 FAD-dependent oxidoreductase [Candidatus Competibacteraceae bacterium]HRY15329.1 FAD/NAD(P)-binding oxidoreductase [Candidatus Competibacteraceae bacterium]